MVVVLRPAEVLGWVFLQSLLELIMLVVRTAVYLART